MGGLDAQGYLFISGRTKEIVNRGGETISPYEVEEAVQQHPFVREVLAFAAPSDQYQETVGVVVVTVKDKPRVDLPSLHAFLEGRLHRAKWPQVIVYSDSLPKNGTGKILRIRFAERTNMRPVDEEAPFHTRLFEMDCPPMGSPLSLRIALSPVQRDTYRTFRHLLTQRYVTDVAVVLMDLAHWRSAVVAFVVLDEAFSGSVEALRDGCVLALDQYDVPQFLYAVKEIPYLAPEPAEEDLAMAELESLTGRESHSGKKSVATSSVWGDSPTKSVKSARTSASKRLNRHGSGTALDREWAALHPNQKVSRDITLNADQAKLVAMATKLHAEQHVVAPRNPTEVKVELAWRSVLQGHGFGSGATALCVTTSFFDMGGDSLKAGQLVNVMRKRLGVHLTVADLFTAPTIEKIAQKVATQKTLGTPDANSLKQSSVLRQREVDRERGRLNSQDRRAALASRVRSASEVAGDSTVWLDKSKRRVIPSYGSLHDASHAAGERADLEMAPMLGSFSEAAVEDTRSLASAEEAAKGLDDDPYFSWDYAPALSSTSIGCLVTQALPIVLIYPLRRIVIWFLVAAPWVFLMKNGWGRYSYLPWTRWLSLLSTAEAVVLLLL
jgi:aryl carrier-like protein